ncbi:hypothetical protein [Brumimicrobium mesophilum]|uniref:hypothetical protein n=1 Tax=Brumimicrobium mesophilum TaxID=392717 RepID=UPI00131ACC6D|nr:hypothetical protein [Brumimicrobium mesophilum]
MKTIFDIPKPKNSSHIIWTHVTTSVITFVGTFALIIFGPMFLGAKTRLGNSKTSALNIIGWMSENPEITYLICFMVAVIANIYIYWKNSKCKFVQKISIVENRVHFQLIDLMFKKSVDYSIPINEFEIKLKSEKEGEQLKTKKISFYKLNQGKPFAEILTRHIIWEKHVLKMKTLLKALHNSGATINRSSRDKKSLMSNLFN